MGCFFVCFFCTLHFYEGREQLVQGMCQVGDGGRENGWENVKEATAWGGKKRGETPPPKNGEKLKREVFFFFETMQTDFTADEKRV